VIGCAGLGTIIGRDIEAFFSVVVIWGTVLIKTLASPGIPQGFGGRLRGRSAANPVDRRHPAVYGPLLVRRFR